MRVPWVLPIRDGADVFPGVGRKPAVVRVTLGLKKNLPPEVIQYLSAEAEKIIARRKPQLLGFYQSCLRGYSAGIVPVMSRHIQFEEGMATYKANNGTEILDIIIYPDLAYNPNKPKVPMQWTYLEFRFEFSIDDGGEDYTSVVTYDRLPKLNHRRGLITRAKIRRPKKVADKVFFLRTMGGMQTQPLYHNGGYRPFYNLRRDERGIENGDDSWCGFDMSDAYGRQPDFAGQKVAQGYDLDNSWDGPLFMAHAGYFTGPTVEKKHYSSYVLDLRWFDGDEPIDIELRSYWGNSFWMDPIDTIPSPFPDVKLTYRLWAGGTVHWPDYKQIEVLPGHDWIEPENNRINYSTTTIGGVTYGPFTHHRLRGASTEGLGGHGAGIDEFGHQLPDGHTFDESENREISIQEGGGLPSTPGIYVNSGLGEAAYSPLPATFIRPGIYFYYVPELHLPGFEKSPVTAIDPGTLTFTRSGPSGTKVYKFPDDMGIASVNMTRSIDQDGNPIIGYEWTYGVTQKTPPTLWGTCDNDCFYNVGGGEKSGVLHKGKQVDFYELARAPGMRNDSYNTPGVYFGNIIFNPVTGDVMFSDKNGPDKKLKGGPGTGDSEFWTSGLP